MRYTLVAFIFLPAVLSFSASDKERISSYFDEPIESLKAAYQVAVAKSILKTDIADSICDFNSKVELSLSDLYFASHLYKIKGCSVNLDGVEEFLRTELNADAATVNVMFKCLTALTNLGLQVDASDYENVAKRLKVEDSVLSYGLAYISAAAVLPEVPKELVDSIEDIAHRADTVGKFMSFEGGLMETAIFLKGCSALSEKANIQGLTAKMTQNFANYILSNKEKSDRSDLFYTLVGLDALKNSNIIPTNLLVLDDSAVISADSQTLKLSLVDPLGYPIKGAVAEIVSSNRASGEALFSPGIMSGSDGLFEASAEVLMRGIYPTELSFELPTGYLSPVKSTIQVKCVVPVSLKDTVFKLVDVEDSRVLTSDDLSSAPISMKVDTTKRLIFDFNLWSDDGLNEVTLHQVFVRFTNVATLQQVYFIAQADLKKRYTVDINFRTAASKSFGSMGGDYKLDLIIGDATLPSAMVTEVATMTLELADSKDHVVDLSKKAKPQITHMFREPEKRPPQSISMLFTGLIFLPALVLFIAWAKLGANVSGIKLTLPSVGFHGGLLAIIVIYVNFFMGTDMFVTVKHLSVAAAVTFLCGQRLLSSIAADKKDK